MAHEHPQDELLASSANLQQTEALLLLAEAHDVLDCVPSEGLSPAQHEQYISLMEDVEDLIETIDRA